MRNRNNKTKYFKPLKAVVSLEREISKNFPASVIIRAMEIGGLNFPFTFYKTPITVSPAKFNSHKTHLTYQMTKYIRNTFEDRTHNRT